MYSGRLREGGSLENKQEVVPQPQPHDTVPVPCNEVAIAPEAWTRKPIGALSVKERNVVLMSAGGKIREILGEGGGPMDRWAKICTTPMTHTEVEVYGDYLLGQARQQYSSMTGLKIAIYWRKEVGRVCAANGKDAESQFYNSYWESGKRVSGPNPRAFDDMTLYELYLDDNPELRHKDGVGGFALGYDTEDQLLYIQVPVATMTELIFCTFSMLQDTRRESPFDRLPNLAAVKMVYVDEEGNSIGEGTYDVNYWAEMQAIDSVPFEVSDSLFDKGDELHDKRRARLISQREFDRMWRSHREYCDEVKSGHYQEKWLKLIGYADEFSLNHDLPLRGKEPFF